MSPTVLPKRRVEINLIEGDSRPCIAQPFHNQFNDIKIYHVTEIDINGTSTSTFNELISRQIAHLNIQKVPQRTLMIISGPELWRYTLFRVVRERNLNRVTAFITIY